MADNTNPNFSISFFTDTPSHPNTHWILAPPVYILVGEPMDAKERRAAEEVRAEACHKSIVNSYQQKLALADIIKKAAEEKARYEYEADVAKAHRECEESLHQFRMLREEELRQQDANKEAEEEEDRKRWLVYEKDRRKQAAETSAMPSASKNQSRRRRTAAAAKKLPRMVPPEIRDFMADHADDARMSSLLTCFNEYLTIDKAHAHLWRTAASEFFNSAMESFYQSPIPGWVPCGGSYDLLRSRKETYMFIEKCPDDDDCIGFAMHRFERIINQYLDSHEWSARTMAFFIFIAFSLAKSADYRDFRQKERTSLRFCATCAPYRFGTLRCARCGEAYYCSRTCQHAHWGLHKESCERAVVCVD